MPRGTIAESTIVSQETEGVRENLDKSLHSGFHWKEWARQLELAGFGLYTLALGDQYREPLESIRGSGGTHCVLDWFICI